MVIITSNINDAFFDNEKGFEYKKGDGYIVITKYKGTQSNLRIPERIENLPVTSIKEYAFAYCIDLASVTIPDSVTEIGESAFEGCKGLTIQGAKDSAAEAYARKMKIPFEME